MWMFGGIFHLGQEKYAQLDQENKQLEDAH